MQVIWNSSKEEHKLKITSLFKDATHFDCAVAFAKNSGLKAIKKELEKFLEEGMSARFIIGLDFYLTDPDVLETLLRLGSKYDITTYVANTKSQVCFHPKIYAFSYKSNMKILTGSANLTSGGFGNNWECSLLVNLQKDNAISRHLQALVDNGDVDELKSSMLDSYRERHRIASAVSSTNLRQVARLIKSGSSNPGALGSDSQGTKIR